MTHPFSVVTMQQIPGFETGSIWQTKNDKIEVKNKINRMYMGTFCFKNAG